MNNSTQNALAFGKNETTRSDFRIFNSDGGALIRQIAESNDFYLSTCKPLLERMVNTVPHGVKLSEPIAPIRVKPRVLDVQILPNATMGITGAVRIIDDGVTSPNRTVAIRLQPRDSSTCAQDSPCGVAVPAPKRTPFLGFDETFPGGPHFTIYDFSAKVLTSQGVSSFTVEVTDNGRSLTETNGDGGPAFPLIDLVTPLLKKANNTSCRGSLDMDPGNFLAVNHTIRIVAQVRTLYLSRICSTYLLGWVTA